jgi:hypothetical protein
MTIITNQQKWLWSEHYVTGHHSANIRHIVKIECEVFEETIWLLLRAFTAEVTHGFSVVRVARSLVYYSKHSENTSGKPKGAIRSRKSKKDTHYNGQKKKDERSNNDIQNITAFD